MADHKEDIGGPDRSGFSSSEEFEVRHFAEAIGLDVEKVRRLIERHGEVTLERESPKPRGH